MNRKEKLEIRFMGLAIKTENITWKGVVIVAIVLLFFLAIKMI